MQKFEVGQLFKEGVTKYQESIRFGFTQAGADTIVYLDKPSQNAIESIRSGKLEIGFYEKESIIFIFFKFQGMKWMDAPYSVHLSQPFEFDELTGNKGFSLTLFLVDASNGILKGIRYIGLGHKFSQELKAAIEKQKQCAFDKNQYEQKIYEIYRNYSTDDLAKRVQHFCRIK